MTSKAFNVYIGNKLIDTVFYQVSKGTISENCEDVRKSLISHDGYHPEIRVVWPKGQRITTDEWVVQGNYGYGHGWEDECSESTWKEGKQRLKEYRENGPGQYHLVCKRVR